jgi:pSer/pThr/pTyr-binding forkhead associated (FHA) protein
MTAALKFKHSDIPRQAQEKARLKVVHGPDSGSVFVITSDRITLGRGDENDIVLADLKTSRQHAEVAWENEKWNIRDLGSSNGINHNGKVTRAAVLKTADIITLGETTLEFMMADAGTSFLRALPKSLTEISKEQAVFSAQQEKVRALAGMAGSRGQKSQAPKNKSTSGQNPRVIIMLVGVGAAAYVMFGMDPPPAPPKPKPQQNLSAYLPPEANTDSAVNKTADVFFRQGFREYLDKNYLRAKVQFETALQISPGHRLAALYLENCDKEINEAVKYELDSGKKDFESGKLKEAKNHFEQVQRLLYRERSSPFYIEAENQSKQVDLAISGVRTSQ